MIKSAVFLINTKHFITLPVVELNWLSWETIVLVLWFWHETGLCSRSTMEIIRFTARHTLFPIKPLEKRSRFTISTGKNYYRTGGKRTTDWKHTSHVPISFPKKHLMNILRRIFWFVENKGFSIEIFFLAVYLGFVRGVISHTLLLNHAFYCKLQTCF